MCSGPTLAVSRRDLGMRIYRLSRLALHGMSEDTRDEGLIASRAGTRQANGAPVLVVTMFDIYV